MDKNIINPISFIKKGEQFQASPISKIEHDINGTTKFAITKSTQNGKWLRAGMLYYSLNGVSIYTEDTNVIFVNTETNTMFIKDNSKVLIGNLNEDCADVVKQEADKHNSELYKLDNYKR